MSTFGGHAWDAGLLLQRAIPLALKKGQPGTPAFREALRAAIESTKDLPASHGIFNMSANDHSGLDQRARVMVEIVGGKWKLVQRLKPKASDMDLIPTKDALLDASFF